MHKLYIRRHTFLKIKDAIYATVKDNRSVPTPLRDSHNDNYVYTEVKTKKQTMQTSEKMYLTNGTEGNFFLKGRDTTKIKLGKILSSMTNLKDHEIEKVVSYWKSIYTIDTSMVEISNDIEEIYSMNHGSNGNLGSSCMRYKGEYMKIYEDLGCKIAYIEKEGKLLGRTILWEELWNRSTGEKFKAYDMIFSANENAKLTIAKWAKDNGYLDLQDMGDRVETIRDVENNYYDYLPYIDTMYMLSNEYKLTNFNNYYGVLQNTDGSYNYKGGDKICDAHDEDDIYCIDTEDYHHMDDCYYCETDGEWYYHDDYLMYYDGNYYHVHEDDNVVYLEDRDEYAHKHDRTYDIFYCEDCGGYYDYNYTSRTHIRDHGTVCENCYESNGYQYCEDCNYDKDDTFTKIEDAGHEVCSCCLDDYYEHEDGKYYTYEEEKDEND